MAEDELDDILDSALADFEADELDQDRADREAANKEQDAMTAKMSNLMDDLQNPDFQKTLEETFKHLSQGSGEMPDIAQFLNAQGSAEGAGLKGNANTGDSSSMPKVDINGKPEKADEEELEKGVAKTLQGLANATEDMEGMETGQAEMMGEEMMQEMMKEFEKMGEKEDFGNVVDGMMRQLLSKEIMYDPMKQICQKYPEWLAEKEQDLKKDDYERYGKQYQYFQKIVAVYDTEPDNFPRLMELMQDMQECGQPPSEIIKELAPGLEFGPDGMPVMPNMGAGMMPGPGGMPMGPNGQPCTIM